MCSVDQGRADAERQLREGAAVLARELERRPRGARASARARLLAELFDALLGEHAPPAVRGAARRLRARPLADEGRLARDGGVVRLACALWRLMADRQALSDERAGILATRLARWLDELRLLHLFSCEAASLRLAAAHRVLRAAVAAREPGFSARASRLPIDRALLEHLELGARVEARFHDNGHLASLCVRGQDAPRLTLARTPGTGSFRDEGRRGGYGYASSERYARGHASGTFCSPWHDGEEYRQAIPWLLWVVECAGTVARAGGAARPRSPRRSRR